MILAPHGRSSRSWCPSNSLVRDASGSHKRMRTDRIGLLGVASAAIARSIGARPAGAHGYFSALQITACMVGTVTSLSTGGLRCICNGRTSTTARLILFRYRRRWFLFDSEAFTIVIVAEFVAGLAEDLGATLTVGLKTMLAY
jgi:hypothetical protein